MFGLWHLGSVTAVPNPRRVPPEDKGVAFEGSPRHSSAYEICEGVLCVPGCLQEVGWDSF